MFKIKLELISLWCLSVIFFLPQMTIGMTLGIILGLIDGGFSGWLYGMNAYGEKERPSVLLPLYDIGWNNEMELEPSPWLGLQIGSILGYLVIVPTYVLAYIVGYFIELILIRTINEQKMA